MIVSFDAFDDDLFDSLYDERVRRHIELSCNRSQIADLLALHLLVFIQQLLPVCRRQLTEFEQLQFGHPKPIIQTNRMNRNIRKAIVLPIENSLHVVMDAALCIF